MMKNVEKVEKEEKLMIKTLAKNIKEFKGASIATPIFMILEVVMEMLIPLITAKIIDEGISGGKISSVWIYGGIMILCALISLLVGYMGGKYGAKASAGFAKNLRSAMYRNIQTYSFANIDKFSTAGLITRLTTDVTNVQNAYQMILRICVRAPISLITAMIMAFTINAKIAKIYLYAIVILAVVLAIIIKCVMKYFSQVFEKYDKLNESIQENVSAVRVVKAYVREDYEKDKFAKASENIRKMFTKAESIIALNGPVMQISAYSCMILVSWFGAKLIVGSKGIEMTTGDLTSMFMYCGNILMSLMMISMIFVMISMSMASARRICEVLNEQSTIHNPVEPVYEVPNGSVEFKNVSFKYNDTAQANIIDNVSFKVKSGETIGIIGATGSSKSSLVNLISRLYDASNGSVLVGGIDVKNYDMDSLRNQVSVVLQKNVLFSGTILDNLRWGNPDASEEECRKACQLACADEFIEKMPKKYETYIEQGGSNVSGGQKQRLCIARALLKKPKILILDDSTSAVDTATDAKIRNAFATEIPDTTKFIIAQRISSIQSADRIIVMNEGRIDAIGTHDELVKNNEIYSEVYTSQTKGSGDFDEGGNS